MKIGFIGLGAMGLSMALNLRRAGYAVTAHDVVAEKAAAIVAEGGLWAASPAEAVKDAELCFTCVSGPTEVEAIARGGLLSAMSAGSTWFDFTTNSPALINSLNEECEKRQISLLDAPISGGPGGARRASLTYWIGGARDKFERYTPVLKIMGDLPIYVGPSGSGCIVKLVHNCAGSMVQQCLAEAFSLGVKAGVAPATLFAALREGTNGRSRTFDRLSEQFLTGQYTPPAFSLRLARKDMGLALTLAEELDLAMPIGERTMKDIEEAVGRGWGENDARIAMHLKEERAAISVKVDPDVLGRILRPN